MKFSPFLTFISLFLYNFINSEIVFVFEQFRNGVYTYKPLGNNLHEQILNLNLKDKQISPASIRSFYLLGTYIKEKYNNIINPKITSKNLFIYSKELDIHVLSSKSQLLGMFPLEDGIHLNQIEIDLAFPQTEIPKDAQNEIKQLGNLSIPKSIKPFALRYFSDEENHNLLSIHDECPRLSKVREQNEKNFREEIEKFNNKHGNELLSIFNIKNDTIINDYNYLQQLIEYYINYYKNKIYLEEKISNNIDINKLNLLYEDCINFQNKSYEQVEATKDISIISMSTSLNELIKFMEKRILFDKEYNENSPKLKADYTPKFVIFSNNGLSLYYLQIFLHETFNISVKYPSFCSNQFIELHRKDGIKFEDLTESDYHIEYFFDGELLLNISFIDFKNKINELEWSSRKIKNFCQYQSSNALDHIFYFSVVSSIIIILISIIRTKNSEENYKNLINADK